MNQPAPIVTADTLARRNTLGCLHENRDRFRSAGNHSMSRLFGEAASRRLELIEAGEVQVGNHGAAA